MTRKNFSIRFSDAHLRFRERSAEINAAIQNVLYNDLYVDGKAVKQFEDEFAEYVGAPYCIGVNSGTDAITIMLRAAGIKPGDHVLVPAHTFVATWHGIRNAGAIPIAVDGYASNIHEHFEDAITEKSKAIVVVHMYGIPSNMHLIRYIASRHGLLVFEDASQAHGSYVDGSHCGIVSNAGAFSLYPTKVLGALGNAGAIVTHNKDIYENSKSLRNYGFRYGPNNAFDIGLNSKLDSVQAAALSVGLGYLDQDVAHRNALAKEYDRLIPKPLQYRNSERFGRFVSPCYYSYPIELPNIDVRGKLFRRLRDMGIEVKIQYEKAAHDHFAYKNDKEYSMQTADVAKAVSDTVLNLPIGIHLNSSDVQDISYIIWQFCVEKGIV